MIFPSITNTGDLCIPPDVAPHYRWWAEGGQSTLATARELGAGPAILARHDPDAGRNEGRVIELAHEEKKH